MTCRDHILLALPVLLRARENQTFTPAEVATFMRARGSTYSPKTIRTQVSYFMCAAEPDPSGTRTQDLERIAPGRYRLRAVHQLRP